MTETKTCPKCGVEKPLEKFHKRKPSKDGRHRVCSLCRNAMRREATAERQRKSGVTRHMLSNVRIEERLADCSTCGTDVDIQRVNSGYPGCANMIRDSSHYSKIFAAYRLTREEYDQMVEDCGNKCEICRRDRATVRTRRLSIDHCHTTGEVRGLLCGRCNSVLGYVEDSTEILRKLALYLENNRMHKSS